MTDARFEELLTAVINWTSTQASEFVRFDEEALENATREHRAARLALIAYFEERTKCRRDLPWCDCTALERERDERTAEIKKLRHALHRIADGDAETWPDCSSRRAAAVALGREATDILRTDEVPR
jgi:hypothetical protein